MVLCILLYKVCTVSFQPENCSFVRFLLPSALFLKITDGEKKAKKRTYEEIQPDDEDFASQSSPAEPPQVLL